MDPQDEQRAQEIIQKLKAGMAGAPLQQNESYTPDPGMIDNQQSTAGVDTKEIPGIGVVADGANLSTNTNPQQPDNNNPSPEVNSPYPTGGSQCPQCGKFHPPLEAGQQCPMAPVTVTTSTGETKVIDVNKFLDKMKVIFLSQLEQKSVLDPDDFEKYLIIETTKAIENYKGPGWDQQQS